MQIFVGNTTSTSILCPDPEMAPLLAAAGTMPGDEGQISLYTMPTTTLEFVPEGRSQDWPVIPIEGSDSGWNWWNLESQPNHPMFDTDLQDELMGIPMRLPATG